MSEASKPYTAIQVPMMPKDTNRHGTIFGGVLLSYIDLAGAITAQRELQLRGASTTAFVCEQVPHAAATPAGEQAQLSVCDALKVSQHSHDIVAFQPFRFGHRDYPGLFHTLITHN